MRVAATANSEDRKKVIAVCVFVVLAALVLYYELRDPTPTSAPPPAAVVTTSPTQASIDSTTTPLATAPAARRLGTTDAALDPTLHMDPMRRTESVAYQGSGRNIFSGVPVEAIPKPIQPARPQANPRPLPIVNPGPPPPPPIDLRFAGYFSTPGSNDRQVILIHGDDVVLARAGDVVLRRYKVISVSANSIQVEDMPNNNQQMLPLAVN